MAKYISCTETAKIIRKELKSNFPGIKFSVRSSSYAGGASISIEWLDGPSLPSVESIVKRFQGATFDGSIDLQSYVDAEWEGEQVHFGADYVNCHRNHSRLFVEAIVKQFCQRYGVKGMEVRGDEKSAWANTNSLSYSYECWYRTLLHQTDAKDMYRAYEAEEEAEKRARAEWEAGAEERARKDEEERKAWAAEEQARKERERIEAEKRAHEQQEQARRQQQQRERDTLRVAQRAVLSSKYTALTYLGLPLMTTDRQVVMAAFRQKVREMSDGKGGYTGDMDFLVSVKDRALQS